MKHYKVFLQGTILNKLANAYTPFILTMIKDLLYYIYTDLRNTIYQITQYFKNNFLKILYTASTTHYNIEIYINKRQ